MNNMNYPGELYEMNMMYLNKNEYDVAVDTWIYEHDVHEYMNMNEHEYD